MDAVEQATAGAPPRLRWPPTPAGALIRCPRRLQHSGRGRIARRRCGSDGRSGRGRRSGVGGGGGADAQGRRVGVGRPPQHGRCCGARGGGSTVGAEALLVSAVLVTAAVVAVDVETWGEKVARRPRPPRWRCPLARAWALLGCPQRGRHGGRGRAVRRRHGGDGRGGGRRRPDVGGGRGWTTKAAPLALVARFHLGVVKRVAVARGDWLILTVCC